MSNLEDFEKITIAMNEAPIALPTEALQNFYLGCMTKYLAQIVDALSEIKDAIKEQEDGKTD